MPIRSPKTGFYIHIPFCRARCGYCDFVAFAGEEDRVGAYVEQLCREIRLQAGLKWGRRMLDTVFFGGGTPSLLEPAEVLRILEALRDGFHLPAEAEVTLEANPESVTTEKAAGWRSAGINRLSLGLQSFDDEQLKTLGRLHTGEGFRRAYDTARQSGFENINIDLIYGLIPQSVESWQETLRAAAGLRPEHLSLYALAIEKNTPFHARGLQVDDERQAEMYEWARACLREQGYEQYEISNFARAGRACEHNLIYWRQQDYIGAGVGAVGCVGAVRWQNEKTLKAYEEAISHERLPWSSEESLDGSTRRFERLMLGLRLREGLEWDAQENPAWAGERSRLAAQGFIEEMAPGRWRIPESRVVLTNQVLLSFLE